MEQIEIIQTLEFTKMELETCYRRLGYTSSSVLKSLDEVIEALSKSNESVQLPLSFVKWYSGMEEDKILKAFKRWKKESSNDH